VVRQNAAGRFSAEAVSAPLSESDGTRACFAFVVVAAAVVARARLARRSCLPACLSASRRYVSGRSLFLLASLMICDNKASSSTCTFVHSVRANAMFAGVQRLCALLLVCAVAPAGNRRGLAAGAVPKPCVYTCCLHALPHSRAGRSLAYARWVVGHHAIRPCACVALLTLSALLELSFALRLSSRSISAHILPPCAC
jgi:hypothetical protein